MRARTSALGAMALVTTGACSSSDLRATPTSDDGGTGIGVTDDGDASAEDGDSGPAASDAADGPEAGEAAAPCTTRITYGSPWLHDATTHPTWYDTVAGRVTWDGTCTDDGANSFALLSNGYEPYFQGHDACIVALDYDPSCGVTTPCTTRVTYGASWLSPPNHPAQYDDVAGRVFSDGACHPSGADAYANLSNGWAPTFAGSSCELSFEYTQCGGLYANPVIAVDCPDPGVLRDGSQYVLTCTSGDAADAYPIYTSPDLVTWTLRGHVFPAGHWPSWAKSDFWAPEIHVVGGQYVVYFSARDAGGQLSIGVASASSALGPFVDVGQPLIHDPAMGLIDASEITASDGTPYVVWKEDGNAIGKPTPIHAQPLAAGGLSLAGSPATLITNDEAWEGAVVEGPFMIEHAGSYYLFYSGNSYASSAYAVGVARAASPLGPFTKAGAPILSTGGAWAGPGHCAVVDTPAGDTYMVYHSWEQSAVGGAPGRLVLTDAVEWQNAWPSVPLSPSSTSRPTP
jgi:arabinan endo-1,5-alpha-L-arabinosidase